MLDQALFPPLSYLINFYNTMASLHQGGGPGSCQFVLSHRLFLDCLRLPADTTATAARSAALCCRPSSAALDEALLKRRGWMTTPARLSTSGRTMSLQSVAVRSGKMHDAAKGSGEPVSDRDIVLQTLLSRLGRGLPEAQGLDDHACASQHLWSHHAPALQCDVEGLACMTAPCSHVV